MTFIYEKDYSSYVDLKNLTTLHTLYKNDNTSINIYAVDDYY